MSCGIYKITNLINNKCYIGQSTDIARRWRNHKSYPIQNSKYPLYQAFQKYGLDNFSWEILEECPIEDLDNRETYYISLYDSYNNGYNQTLGGSGSANYSIKLSIEDVTTIYDLLQNSSISQKEIAQLFNVGQDTISEINQGKTRINSKLNYPLRNNKRDITYCQKCNAPISYGATYCNNCIAILNRIVERPDREILKDKIRNQSFVSIGKEYGVTDNSIRKWCLAYSLPTTKKIIKSYSDEEWNNL